MTSAMFSFSFLIVIVRSPSSSKVSEISISVLVPISISTSSISFAIVGGSLRGCTVRVNDSEASLPTESSALMVTFVVPGECR